MRWLIALLFVGNLSSDLALADESAAAPAASPASKSITLIRPPEPREYMVMNKGSAMAGLGAIGGALMALDSYQSSKGLLGALARTKFSFSEQFTQDLSAALAAGGYRVVMASADRGSRPDKLLEDYSAVWATDAGTPQLLDVSVAHVGYSTEHFMFSSHWRPDVMVYAALVSRTGGERLYEERIMYGYHNMFLSAAKLDAAKAFQFADQEAMEAAEDTVLIGGLKDASKAIAARIVQAMPPSPGSGPQP